tara:strand:- start:72 stop:446 length:375 start_codon:yes stop_codon:yes gene_type:complete
MDFEYLNENNFIMYAMKLYENPQCSGIDEFQEDLNRIKYIKRLLRRYHKTGVLKERLILNHIIIIANVFGIEGTVKILFYKIEKDLHSILKTFLVFLQYMPELQSGEYDLIPLDNKIIDKLRKL